MAFRASRAPHRRLCRRDGAAATSTRLPFGIAMLVVIFTGTAVIESFARPDRLRPFAGQAVTFALGSAAALLAAHSSRARRARLVPPD